MQKKNFRCKLDGLSAVFLNVMSLDLEIMSLLLLGYQTARGRLVQSILFPKPVEMKLQNDAIHFVMLMGVISLIGSAIQVSFILE